VNWMTGPDHPLDAPAALLALSDTAAGAGERERATTGAKDRTSHDGDVGLDARPGTTLHVRPESAQPTGGGSCSEPRPEIERDPGVGRDHEAGRSMIFALITASAAVLPSTAA
jgi:hypothetical protein